MDALKLTPRQLRALLLPGTVVLPCFPTLGKLTSVHVGASEGFPGTRLLAIEEKVGLHGTITRKVLLEHVVAVFTPEPKEPDFDSGKWFLGEKLRTAEFSGDPGMAFIDKHAPVLTTGEFGATAEESAEYSLFGLAWGCDCCLPSCYKSKQVMGEGEAKA